MADIRIAYDCSTWGRDGLAQCTDDLCDLGFWGIEASGELVKQYYDKLNVFRQMLALRGLRLAAMSSHAGPAGTAEELEKEAAFSKMICEFLCGNRAGVLVLNAGPRRAEGPSSDDDFKRMAELCNQIGEYSKRLRIKTCVLPRPGSVIETRAETEKILELTDPSLVYLCPDTGHLAKLGENVAEAVRAHINRIGHIHFKDFAAQSASDPAGQNTESYFTELGKGCVDFPAIVETLHGANYNGIITIELDKTRLTPKESAQTSKTYVETVLGISVHPRPIPIIVEPPPRPSQPEAVKAAEAPRMPEPSPPPEPAQAVPPTAPVQEATPAEPAQAVPPTAPVQEVAPAEPAQVVPPAAPVQEATPAEPAQVTPAPEAVAKELEKEHPPMIPTPEPPHEESEPPAPAAEERREAVAASGEEAGAEAAAPKPAAPQKPPEPERKEEKQKERGFGYGILPDEDE